MPKIRHQSPRTSWAERRRAATGRWPSKTTIAGARQNLTQSQAASGPVARAPRIPTVMAVAAPEPLSRVTAAMITPTKATMISVTGTATISAVRINVPITGARWDHARRHTVENSMGLPSTASCSTVGTAAYIRPETIIIVMIPSTARTPTAVTSETTSDEAASSS